MMGMELGRRMRRFFLTIITDFYTCLFTSLNPQDLDRVLEGVDAVVTESMRTDLERPFTSEEVGVAIKEMALLKAPCSDVCHLYFIRLIGLISVWMFLKLFYLV